MGWSLPPTTKVYFATGLVDMRKGIDGLCAIVEATLKKNPLDGHLYVFVGKTRDKVKILYWDRNGFALHMKRLEQGRFQMPAVDEHRLKIEMDATELAMLLDGVDLNAKRLARWKPQMAIDEDPEV
jgi:transposase